MSITCFVLSVLFICYGSENTYLLDRKLVVNLIHAEWINFVSLSVVMLWTAQLSWDWLLYLTSVCVCDIQWIRWFCILWLSHSWKFSWVKNKSCSQCTKSESVEMHLNVLARHCDFFIVTLTLYMLSTERPGSHLLTHCEH